MRISSQQVYRQGIDGITRLNEQTQRVQQQIASGQRLLTPADDPVAASRIISIESQLRVSEQYLRNADLAENRLQIIEGSLASAEDVIVRIRELVISAENGALNNDDRTAIAIELDERLQELVSLTNTRDADGDYIFGGFDVDAPPFTETAAGFIYVGDEGQRLVQISNSAYVAVTEPGSRVFDNVPVVSNRVDAEPLNGNTSTANIVGTGISDQLAFDAVFPEDFIISFGDVGNIAPAGPNYTITRQSDGEVLAADVPFDVVSGISFNGIDVAFDGVPNPGDRYLLTSTTASDMLSIVQRIANGVDSFADNAERSVFIADAIEDLSSVQAVLLEGRSRIGARLNTIDSTRNTLQTAEVSNQAILSDIRDLDYAEAVSNLSFLSFVLEASQQSFVRVAGLSLFNFLR